MHPTSCGLRPIFLFTGRIFRVYTADSWRKKHSSKRGQRYRRNDCETSAEMGDVEMLVVTMRSTLSTGRIFCVAFFRYTAHGEKKLIAGMLNPTRYRNEGTTGGEKGGKRGGEGKTPVTTEGRRG